MNNQYAKQRTIRDIKNDDLKIQITGYIDEINNDNTILLDDGTGQITADLKEIEFNLKKKDLINFPTGE